MYAEQETEETANDGGTTAQQQELIERRRASCMDMARERKEKDWNQKGEQEGNESSKPFAPVGLLLLGGLLRSLGDYGVKLAYVNYVLCK